MVDITAKVDDEKLLSLYHPFDTQINKAMNNEVSRQFQKKVFAGSGAGLQYSGFGKARSDNVHEKCLQTMWNGIFTTARILLYKAHFKRKRK